MKLRDLKIGLRLGAGFATVIFFILVIMVAGVVYNRSIYGHLQNIYETNNQCIRLANQMDQSFNGVYLEMRNLLLTPDTVQKQECCNRMKAHREDYARSFQELQRLDLTPEGQSRLKALEEEVAKARSTNDNLISLGLTGQIGPAAQLMQNESEPARLELERKREELIQYQENLAVSSFQQATQAYHQAIIIMLLMGFGVIGAGALFSLALTRSISLPLGRLLQAAGQAATGDLMANVDSPTQDEIGRLAGSFQLMLDKTRQLVGDIIGRARVVAESSQQLQQTAQQASSTVNETAAAMGEIASAVEQVAGSIQEIAAAAHSASQSADQGKQGIHLIRTQMASIAEATTQVAEGIGILDQKSQAITQIVELITNIADQTNLLALNAAIEAGRAGERGRGFAVVADEIRKLAEQSARAAREIKSLVLGIQQDSQGVVSSMEAGSREVNAGSRVVQEVATAFDEIIRTVEQLSCQIQGAASATEQTSASVEEVAAATEEQTAAVEEVSSSSACLSGLASELQALTSRFKVA